MTDIPSLLQWFEGCQTPLHQLFSVPAWHYIRRAAATAKLAFIHVRSQRINLKSRRVRVGLALLCQLISAGAAISQG
ncbi:hypothetical protein B8W72_10730 [Pseudomonas putida]|uniref:Uncharacterized protein n=1 Tax=Pseudomonas putida TaxID=303 RepID=A0A1Y3LHA2_PSEPU|nr:hypothetical protein B8W72_10730 [Pseudomonas putida]